MAALKAPLTPYRKVVKKDFKPKSKKTSPAKVKVVKREAKKEEPKKADIVEDEDKISEAYSNFDSEEKIGLSLEHGDVSTV